MRKHAGFLYAGGMKKQETYEAMAAAITYMRTAENAGISGAAKAAGMSVSRFEHVFAEWAGTTPKRFLNYLLKEKAKTILEESEDILKATCRAGLSGPNRLHELMVTYEALSPSELKKGNIEITYGVHDTLFGWCVIGITGRGICALFFVESSDQKIAIKRIKEVWAAAALKRDDAKTLPFIKKIFASKKTNKPLHLVIKGTNFQIKVWEALLSIPEGQTLSYKEVAEKTGFPKAVRAVGTACGKNAIALLIPCHRVLTSGGAIGGYRWGTKRKEAILARESVRSKS